MNKKLAVALLAAVTVASAQRVTDRRTAEIRGGGGEGKCTIEVRVDDTAEVEINGRNAVIRTLSGTPSTFRRFECNQQMPNRPYEFRFAGVDGRGRQELIRSAADGGRAVIRIEDSQGGNEGYTFDIFWRGNGGNYQGNNQGDANNGYRNRDAYNDRRNDNANNAWNNGWGDGPDWTGNTNFNFEGGRKGSGGYQDRNSQRRRLDNARVSIGNNGLLSVAFQTDRGRIELMGRVERRQGRRIFGNVNGAGMSGMIEIEMGSQNTVNRIAMRDIGLVWSN